MYSGRIDIRDNAMKLTPAMHAHEILLGEVVGGAIRKRTATSGGECDAYSNNSSPLPVMSLI